MLLTMMTMIMRKVKKSDEGDNEGCVLMMMMTMRMRKVKSQMRVIMRAAC